MLRDVSNFLYIKEEFYDEKTENASNSINYF